MDQYSDGQVSRIDWLSQLLQMIDITGQLQVRCVYGAPWRVAWDESAAHEIPYHIVLKGRAVLKIRRRARSRKLLAGDILLLPHGAAHVLHDGSGHAPGATSNRQGSAGWTLSENDGKGGAAGHARADGSSSGRRTTG